MQASRGLPSDSFANLPKVRTSACARAASGEMAGAVANDDNAVQELVQQILRLAPFGLANSFLGAPMPANGHSSGSANGFHHANGTMQVRC